MKSKAVKALSSVTAFLLLAAFSVSVMSADAVTYSYRTKQIGEGSYHVFYEVKADGSDGSSYEFLSRTPSKVRKALELASKKQIDTINAMAYECPDVNHYVYIPTALENTALGGDIYPAEATDDIFDSFVSGLSSDVDVGYLKIESVADRYEKYFISDHHWNRYGSYEGYCDIVAMMQKNHPDFGEPRKIVEDYDFSVKLYGSIASEVRRMDYYDDFGVLDLGLPRHTLTRNTSVPYGGNTEFDTLVDNYLSGNYDKSRGYNHFMNFYQIPQKIEYPDNHTGRNLLMICDSFSTCVSEAIASHFDTTYVRYVDSVIPKKIDYADYLRENKITDVLILQESARVVSNIYGDSIKNINLYGESVHTLEQTEPEKLAGDVNGDGKINSKDISTMLKIIAGWNVEYIKDNSDYNGDGKFNSMDVFSMLVDSSKGII